MAKVTLEFDSVDKTASVTVDGKVVENLYSFSLYKKYPYANDGMSDDDGDEDDQYYMDISMMEDDDEEGMRRSSRICASEIVAAKASITNGADTYKVEELPGYLAFAIEGSPANSELADEIASYLASYKPSK